jgi:hypothetical protein
MPASDINYLYTDGTSVRIAFAHGLPAGGGLVATPVVKVVVAGGSGTFGLTVDGHPIGPFAVGCLAEPIRAALPAGGYAIAGGAGASFITGPGAAPPAVSVDASGLSASFPTPPFAKDSGSNLATAGTIYQKAFAEQNQGGGHWYVAPSNWAVHSATDVFLQGAPPTLGGTNPAAMWFAVPAVGYYRLLRVFPNAHNFGTGGGALPASAARYLIFDGDPRSGGVLRAVVVDDQQVPDPNPGDFGHDNYTVASAPFCVASGRCWVVMPNDGTDAGTVSAQEFDLVAVPAGAAVPAADPAIAQASSVPVVGTVGVSGGAPAPRINGTPVSFVLPYADTSAITYAIDPGGTPNSVGPGDTLTIDFPDSWVLANAGPEPAQSGVPVPLRPLVHGKWRSFLDPFDLSAPRAMRMGAHAHVVNASIVPVYSNLMKQCDGWRYGGGAPMVLDPDGQLLSTAVGGVDALANTNVLGNAQTFIDPDRGMQGGPWGIYTIVGTSASGTGSCRLASQSSDYVGPVGNATGHSVVTSGPFAGADAYSYDFQPSPTSASGPQIQAIATNDFRVLGMFRPGLPYDGTAPRFDPEMLRQVPDGSVIRTTGFGPIVNPGLAVEYAHFPRPTFLTYNGRFSWPSVQVSAIQLALTGPQAAFAASKIGAGRHPFAFILSSGAHDFVDGDLLGFFDDSNASRVYQDAGGTSPEPWNICGNGFYAYFYDSTTAICEIGGNNLPNVSATLGTGTPRLTRGREGAPPEDAVAFVNAVPGGGLWLAVPINLSDAGCHELFAMVAADLAPGRTLRVELANEPWNGDAVFLDTFQAIEYMKVQRSFAGSHMQMYAQLAAEVQAIALAEWTSAGRDPADFYTTFNCVPAVADGGSSIREVMDYLHAHGYPCHEVATSVYWDLYVVVPGDNDAATADQALALMEHVAGGYGYNGGLAVAAINDRNAANGTAAVGTIYEGGPARLGLKGAGAARRPQQAQAMHLHPRFHNLALWILSYFEAYGIGLFIKAGLTSPLSSDAGIGIGQYGAYDAFGQRPGIGDGSDGQADNLPEVAAIMAGGHSPDYGGTVSPMGQALWDYQGTATPTPTMTLSANSTSVGVDLVGTASGRMTGWDGSTTLSVSGGAGASIDSGTVDVEGQSIPFTLHPGSSPGTLTIGDSSDGATAIVTVTAAPAPAFTVSPTTVPVGGSATVTATGNHHTAWAPGTTFSVARQPGTTATFLGADSATRGNWHGVYGAEGYSIASDASGPNPVLPPYVSLIPTQAYPATWSTTTSDPRALQNVANTGRIAAGFFGAPQSFDLNFNDGNAHTVSLYLLDWDGWGGGRSQRVDVVDASTGDGLSSQTVSSFGGGVYLSWAVSGHVRFVVTNLNPSSNNVVNAIFFDPCAAPSISGLAVDDAADPQTATFTLHAGGAAGTLVISDSADPATATLAARVVASVVVSPTSAVAGATGVPFTLTGHGTSWTGATAATLSGGAGAAIVSQSIAGQVITGTFDAGSAAGTLTFGDTADSATATVAVSAAPAGRSHYVGGRRKR